ncbi:MAG TPA: glycoside hydrolase family 2 protein, partial [Candidatus Atribacteria bacterium]|nr:glycoside hydrolase family 2 protein [Candidatus Atribacteria bacterium]
MKISLNGEWRVYDEEKEFDFEGNVPGTVQGDLVNLNLMPHPYVGTNEKLFRRLEEKSWIYERTFYLDKLDSKSHYDLVLEGVDTLSQVYVNGEFAGKTEN